MKRCLLIAAAAAWALCKPVWAAPVNFSDPYVELSVGVATGSNLAFDGVNASLDSGPAASIGLGFARFVGPVDLRLDYMTTDRDTCFALSCIFGNQGVTSSSTMLSALYNLPVGEGRWEAYVGAGAGMVKVEVENTGPGFSGSDNVFGWQLVGGARVRLFDWPIRLLVEYRYQSSQDAHVQGHTVEYNSNSLAAGVRWTF
ncbi:MAG TPA: outer membrane beta-barrel protein [Burkholderiales bacterium]|nr:outer membrane beta-barrel protein [Burkholderiales bacterium]